MMKTLKIILFFFSLLLLFVAINNFLEDIEFLKSDKIETIATIKEVEGTKMYSFPEINYSVSGQDPEIKNIGNVGEKVTIYYQKNKPYIVYRSKNPKWIWLNAIFPFLFSMLLLSFIYLLSSLLPKFIKKELSSG